MEVLLALLKQPELVEWVNNIICSSFLMNIKIGFIVSIWFRWERIAFWNENPSLVSFCHPRKFCNWLGVFSAHTSTTASWLTWVWGFPTAELLQNVIQLARMLSRKMLSRQKKTSPVRQHRYQKLATITSTKSLLPNFFPISSETKCRLYLWGQIKTYCSGNIPFETSREEVRFR